MKKFVTGLIILAILLASGGAGTAQAGAYETSFITAITYQNISQFDADNVVVLFYSDPTDDTPVVLNRPSLAAGAGTSFSISSVGDLPAGFRGTAIMTSDQEMAATLVQVPDSTTVKARPLSNGFSSGSPTSLVATFFKQPNINSIMSVQNAGTADANLTLKFYAVGALTPSYTINQTVKSGTGYVLDGGQTNLIGSSFNGSVVIETGGTGSIVSSVVELGTGTSTAAKAFEGVGQGSNTFYMPSATCNTTNGAATYYAVQNTSTTAGDTAAVTVTYQPGGYTQSTTIQPGNKYSFRTCDTPGIGGNYLGAAVITSVGAPIIAIGKVDGAGQNTAFTGFSSGASKVALPYVRWATNTQWTGAQRLQRTYIAIQNVGSAIAAGEHIYIRYINPDGSIAGTHDYTGGLAQYAKFNSNATNAGLTGFGYLGGVAGGSVIVEGPTGSQLAVLARVQTYVTSLNSPGEDYNGIPVPTP